MESVFLQHFLAGIMSCSLTYVLVPRIMRIAVWLGLIDRPDGKLKQHKQPIPYLGGLAVYLGFVLTLAALCPLSATILWLLLGSSILLVVGLIDDSKALTPLQKFTGQFLAVACFLHGGMWLKTIFFASWLHIGCAAFWMLTVINAFNLVDIMDGLASTIALCAIVTFCGIAVLVGDYTVSLLLVTLAGALLAFLRYNKPPAQMYLGDAGALFLGGFLSATPLLLPWTYFGPLGFYAPAIILAIPVAEVCSLVAIRTWLGIPFFRGSPHHFAIFLQRKGWSKERVLLFCMNVSGILATIVALCLNNIIDFFGMVALVTITAAWGSYVVYSGISLQRTSAKQHHS